MFIDWKKSRIITGIKRAYGAVEFDKSTRVILPVIISFSKWILGLVFHLILYGSSYI